MNELAVDAQLYFHSNDDYGGSSSNDQSGEMWSLSSCPLDKTLIVTCREHAYNSVETALWRIPETAMKEDEIDYYPDEELDHGNMNVRAGATSRNMSDVSESLVKVDVLDHGHDGGDGGDNRILKARVSDMQWNPSCLPQFDDEYDAAGGYSNTGIDGVNFMTVLNNRTSTANDNHPTIYTWDISTSSTTFVNKVSVSTTSSYQRVPNPPKLSWDPHNTNLCAITTGYSISIVDFRSGDVVSGIKNCHKFGVLDVDYNPNKPNVVSTCGQDALIKFWDLRYSSSGSSTVSTTTTATFARQPPLRILRGGHTHWTTKVKYNSFHDQLLLSSGTDGMVNLWRVSSISSAPLLDLGGATTSATNDGMNPTKDNFQIHSTLSGFDDDEEERLNMALNSDTKDEDEFGEKENNMRHANSFSDETDGGNAPDVRVTKMEMREAVYDLDWSAADPWIYVTLGFDGNVVLNHVPSKEKYKILL